MPESPRRILAVETSGCAGSTALGTLSVSGPQLLAASHLPGDMRHTAELMPAIDGLLRDQGWPADTLTDVFVSIGPGSFTGLRIGVTVARTLAWSIGAGIVAVPTMDALARNALDLDPPPAHLAVVLDAKRDQVFAAAFELRDNAYVKTIDERMIEPRALLDQCPRPLAVLGEGLRQHRPSFDGAPGVHVIDENLWPARAENVFHVGIDLARAGGFTPPAISSPLYIRRPDPVEKWEQKQKQ